MKPCPAPERPALRPAFAILACALALASPVRAAVTITDLGVVQSGNDIALSYRLNQAATSVTIQAGGQSYTGATQKGLNTVSLPGSLLGQSATITATAPAANGAGGAAVLVPFTRQTTAPNAVANLVGIDVVTRADSPYRGYVYTAGGFGGGEPKALFAYASDGSLLTSRNLNPPSSLGSWPFGLAVAKNDPNDYVYVANRSGKAIVKFNPNDLAVAASLTSSVNNYIGMSVTPNTDAKTQAANPWNIYLGGNNAISADQNGYTVYHWLYDGATKLTTAIPFEVASTTNSATNQAVAVDATNRVLFKVNDGPINVAAPDRNISKWTSTDNGATWTEEPAWLAGLLASIPDAGAEVLGVALDAGFDAGNLANSWVWISVNQASTVNKLYRVNAATGAIDAASTIDLRQVAVPSGTQAIADEPGHFLSVDAKGNIVLTVGRITLNTIPLAARYWGILAPNTAQPTSDTVVKTLAPNFTVKVRVDHPAVGNTGQAVLTFTADVIEPNGQAGNVTVTGDLSQIGGPATLSLAKDSVSQNGITAVYSGTYTVPAAAKLGTYDLPFLGAVNGKQAHATVNQTVYLAYVPVWAKAVDGPVNASSGVNGDVAYVGTDAGSVYAFRADGSAVTSFGLGGKVSLPEPVKGQIVSAYGKLFVTGATRLYILSNANGALLGTSAALTGPLYAAAHPADPTKVFVASGDHKIHALNATTGAELYASADLGAAVNRPALGPSNASGSDFLPIGYLLAAGTEAVSGSGGKIVLLNPKDLKPAFTDFSSNPISYTDPKGAVRGRASFIAASTELNTVAIGGASGLWGINADTGAKLGEGTTDQWSTATAQEGNPYAMATPVDANTASGYVGGNTDGTAPVPGYAFATTGNADSGGQLNIVSAGSGTRVSFGGLPITLTRPGSGFAEGSGILYARGKAQNGEDNSVMVYLGSDANDQRFFGLETLPQSYEYGSALYPIADRKHIFDPADTVTFTGYTPGAFNDEPVLACTAVVVGSSAGTVYGFDPVLKPPTCVTAVDPANGAANVATDKTITVTFNISIDTTATDRMKVYDQSGAEVAGEVAAPDATHLTFTPASAWTTGQTYTVAVGPVPNASAPVVGPSQPFSSTFYVGPRNVKGDVDGNGVFNAGDVLAALQMAGGLIPATPEALAAADIPTSGNATVTPGLITAEDAVVLLRVLNGKAAFQ